MGPSHSPVRITLVLTNLPTHIRPSHIQHILQNQPNETREHAKRRDTDLDMVQVYSRARRTPKTTLWKRICPTREASGMGDGSSPRGSIEKPRAAATSPVSDETGAELEDDGAWDGDGEVRRRIQEVGEEEDEEEAKGGAMEQDPDREAVAYLHFRTEGARWRAQWVFQRITIDGRKVGVRTKVFDGAPLRRLFAKVR